MSSRVVSCHVTLFLLAISKMQRNLFSFSRHGIVCRNINYNFAEHCLIRIDPKTDEIHSGVRKTICTFYAPLSGCHHNTISQPREIILINY